MFSFYLQKISPSGKKPWGEAGIAVAKISAKQKNPELINDGAGGTIVVWEDYRNPAGPKIFSQRINAKGKKRWNKTGNALTGTKGFIEQTKPKIVPGAIVVWEEYQGNFNAKDILSQRIDLSGNILWGKKGRIIASGGGDQSGPQISSNLIITWSDKRADGYHSDIYAQKISLAGKILWEEDGVPICQAPDSQIYPSISNNTIAWTDKSGGSFDIYAQMISPQGLPLWIKDGIAICQSARTQQRPKMSSNVNLSYFVNLF